jgi:hypothetical protein
MFNLLADLRVINVAQSTLDGIEIRQRGVIRPKSLKRKPLWWKSDTSTRRQSSNDLNNQGPWVSYFTSPRESSARRDSARR